jgi:peptidoglycan hydrolase FlgJ
MDSGLKMNMAVQQATASVTARPGAAAPDAAQTAAREFEAVFLTNVMEEMLKSVDIGEFGGGNAEETWRGFLARAYADQMAGQGVTGIAQSVLGTIKAYQDAQNGDQT